MVDFAEFRNNALEQYRKYFHENNFKLCLLNDDLLGFEKWVKAFLMKDKKGRETLHYVTVLFCDSFPYTHPIVFTDPDTNFVRESRHQNAFLSESSICLWHDYDWDIHTSPEVFYNRLKEWFQRSVSNIWKESDLLADLDLHFEHNYILAISGEGWETFNFHKFGYFKYLEMKKQYKIQSVYLFEPKLGLTRNGQYLPISLKKEACNEPILKEFYNENESHFEDQQNGIWFFLNSEPKPCKTFNELIQQIKKLSGIDKNLIMRKIKEVKDLSSFDFFILSIIYNDIHNQKQFIHFKVKKNDLKFTTFKTCKCDNVSLDMRINHLKTKVQDKSIAIFGIGAIGSVVADSLGKHGLNTIKLIDIDEIEPSNVLRHRLGVESIGLNKAYAMQSFIEKHSINSTKILAYDDVYCIPQKIQEIINDVDLVVDCTANKNFSFLLNHLCIEKQKISVYIISQKKASIGQVRIVRPFKDPCLCCYEGEGGIVQNYEKYNYPFIPKGDDDEIVLSCGDATYPAVSSDIEMIAIWGVKIILWILQNKFDYNHCLIVNDIIENAPDYLKEIGHKFRTFEKVKGCEICDK